jgi:hypothetical protein
MSSTVAPVAAHTSAAISPKARRGGLRIAAVPILVPAVATLASIVLALVAWQYGNQPIRGDAQGYFDLAAQMAREGPLSFASTFRTYGYPAFLALLIKIVGPTAETVRTAGFFVQLALYVVAAAVGARQLSRALGKPSWQPWLYAITVFSPFILLHTIQMLTDVPSATLVYLAVVLSLPTSAPATTSTADGTRRATHSTRQTVLLAMLALLLAGFAVAIRPSSLIVLPVILGCWLLRTVRFHELPWRAWPVLLAMVALPFVPQMVFNYRAYGVPNPLLMLDLYTNNSLVAMKTAKYATISVTGVPARLYYNNPFGPEENMLPLAYLRQDPARFAITLGIHVFALFDQDFPFTYITDFTPWYRWPLSVPNYLYVLLGFIGLVLGVRRPSGETPEARSRFRFAFGLLGVSIGLLVAIYLPVLVENRYSLPIYPLMAAPVLLAVLRLWAAVRGRPARLAATALLGAVWVAAMCSMSLWMDQQAPALLAAREVMANSVPPSPSATYQLSVPNTITPGEMLTLPIQVQNTGTDTWSAEGYFPVAVRVQFVALKTEQHRLLPKGSRVYAPPLVTVPPGGTVDVTATVEAPTASGRYMLTVTVMRHGIDETAPGFEKRVTVGQDR